MDEMIGFTEIQVLDEKVESGPHILYPDSVTIFASVCATIFALVGVIGNLVTFLALLKSPKLKNHATTAFIVSLCVSDFLFCAISLPLQAIRFATKSWTLGEAFCRIFPLVLYGNVAVSLLSMVCITMNRYILISYNHLYPVVYTSRNIIIQLISIWGIAFGLMIPPLVGIWGRVGLDEATFSCTILRDENGRSPKKMLFLVGFLLPCIVIIISYSCIYWTVRRQKKRVRSHSKSANTQRTALSTKKEREDTRLTGMMLTIFCCFLLCFLPLMATNVFDSDVNLPTLHVIASVLAWASGVINPFIYAVSNRNYRIAYLKLFNKFKFWGKPLLLSSTASPGVSQQNGQLSNNRIISAIDQSDLITKDKTKDLGVFP